MSALINVSINLDKVPENEIIKGKTGRWVNLTISVQDELNQYKENVNVRMRRNQDDDRDNCFIGNGSVAWVSEKGVKKL